MTTHRVRTLHGPSVWPLMAAVLSAAPSFAQTTEPPRDVARVLTASAAFTPADITLLQSGRVVVKTQVSADNSEASVVAAVQIGTPKDRAADYLHQLIAYVDGQVTQQFGHFGREPASGDVAGLTLDAGDLVDLRACVASGCQIRMGAATPAEIVGAVDWQASDVGSRANDWMRGQIARFAGSYTARGTAGLRVFTERAAAVDTDVLWRSFESGATILSALAPAVGRYLSAYPAPPPSGLVEELYWDKQHYTGLKPVIGVTHLITWRNPLEPDRIVVAQKQIFASHYFFGAFAVTLLLQDNRGDTPVTYVVYTNRTRGDLLQAAADPAATGLRARLNNFNAGLRRRLGEELVRQSADRLLGAMKQALER